MNNKYATRCIRCKNVIELTCNPESLALYREGKLPVQQCLTELKPEEREMLISGFCPVCWDDLFGNMEEAENTESFGATHEHHSWRDEAKPLSFWQAFKLHLRNWKKTKIEVGRDTMKLKVTDIHDPDFARYRWNETPWLTLYLRMEGFPNHLGSMESCVYFRPVGWNGKKEKHYLRLPWHWIQGYCDYIPDLCDEKKDGLRLKRPLKKVLQEIRSLGARWEWVGMLYTNQDPYDPNFLMEQVHGGAWLILTLKPKQYKAGLGYHETQIYFGMYQWTYEGNKTTGVRFKWNPLTWFWWDSTHIANWFGRAVEAPHGTCYVYNGILGNHVDC
jgi:hypothetical protein